MASTVGINRTIRPVANIDRKARWPVLLPPNDEGKPGGGQEPLNSKLARSAARVDRLVMWLCQFCLSKKCIWKLVTSNDCWLAKHCLFLSCGVDIDAKTLAFIKCDQDDVLLLFNSSRLSQ